MATNFHFQGHNFDSNFQCCLSFPVFQCFDYLAGEERACCFTLIAFGNLGKYLIWVKCIQAPKWLSLLSIPRRWLLLLIFCYFWVPFLVTVLYLVCVLIFSTLCQSCFAIVLMGKRALVNTILRAIGLVNSRLPVCCNTELCVRTISSTRLDHMIITHSMKTCPFLFWFFVSEYNQEISHWHIADHCEEEPQNIVKIISKYLPFCLDFLNIVYISAERYCRVRWGAECVWTLLLFQANTNKMPVQCMTLIVYLVLKDYQVVLEWAMVINQ